MLLGNKWFAVLTWYSGLAQSAAVYSESQLFTLNVPGGDRADIAFAFYFVMACFADCTDWATFYAGDTLDAGIVQTPFVVSMIVPWGRFKSYSGND